MPSTSYITDIDGLVHTAAGWVSITEADTQYYDGSIYRNELSAAYAGLAVGDAGVYGADFKAKDDRYNATPPWPTQKTLTERKWLDGSGNVICSIPLCQLPMQSSAQPFYAS